MAPTFTDEKTEELERAANPNDREQQELVSEMRAHLKKLQDMRQTEDPRLSFSTPEFKEAQRVFTDNFKIWQAQYERHHGMQLGAKQSTLRNR